MKTQRKNRRRKIKREEELKIKINLFLFVLTTIIATLVIFSETEVQASDDEVIVLKIQIEQPEEQIDEEPIEVETAEAETFESLPDILDTLSEDELYYLAECVQIEAGGESFEGKKAVASVLINRVNSAKFPSSYKEVVTQKINGVYQFSSYSDGCWGKKEISDEVYNAIRDVLQNGSNVGNATYFANLNVVKSGWFYTAQKSGDLIKVSEIGGHTFFKTK